MTFADPVCGVILYDRRLRRKPRREQRARGAAGKTSVVAKTAASAVSREQILGICIALVVATFIIYFQTFAYDFVFYDDDVYVYQNPMVQMGISRATLFWAFTTFHASSWLPLTWISFMVDHQLFGLSAGAEHAINVVFHAGAAVLLFLAFLQMTGYVWRSALVAAIFALHPLRVESVAWVTERKDVLSGFFLILALLFYVRYSKTGRLQLYLGMVGSFAFSVLAKSTGVTLPLVLLILDVWPLRRWEPAQWRTQLKGLLLEKLPLFALSVLASTLTFLAGQQSGKLVSLPYIARMENAVLSYVRYIGKAVWPSDLAVLYPYSMPSFDGVFLAALILTAITITAVILFQRYPYILVGWVWYIAMLAPVIGFVQIGAQAMADRFTYMPLIGFSVMVIWSAAEAVQNHRVLHRVAMPVGVLVLVALAAAAHVQASYWKNSDTLFRHTLATTTGNYIIATNLGLVVQRAGDGKEAEALYRQALAVNPKYAGAQNNLGEILMEKGQYQEATERYRRALVLDPSYAEAHANLGRQFLRSAKFSEAEAELWEALRLKPDLPKARNDIGVLLAAKGNFEQARQQLAESVRLKPTDAESQSNLCYALELLGRLSEALSACNAALQLDPNFLGARFNRGTIFVTQGRRSEAVSDLSSVLTANPDYPGASDALQSLQKQ